MRMAQPPSFMAFFAVVSLLLVLSASLTLGKETCATCEFVVGRAQGALSLAGTDSSIVLSRATSKAIQHSATPLSFTLESWVYLAPNEERLAQPIFARYPRTAPIRGNSFAEFLLQLQGNGNLNLFFGGGWANPNRVGLELDCGFNVLRQGEWAHVALTVDTPAGQTNPATVLVYVNGQSVCGWSTLDGGEFDGKRQVMHDQPFAVGNYEDIPEACGGVAQTMTTGTVDELRVWAGARSSEEILAWYADVVPATSAGLVGQFHFDREPIELLGEQVFDSSPIGANAMLTDAGLWIPSTAPILSTVTVANFQMTPVNFYAYATDPADGWFVVLSGLPGDAQNVLYQDAHGLVPLTSGATILTAPNARNPVAYFKSTSPRGTQVSVPYTVVSRDSNGDELVFDTTEVVITVVPNGCDGAGGKFDRCDVCNGDGKCAPYGCDGQGNELDDCGDCNGDNNGCACALTSWRNHTAADMDESLAYAELAGLDQVVQQTQELLDEVTQLLLSGHGANQGFTCATYTDVLDRVKALQTKANAYNRNALQFLNSLE